MGLTAWMFERQIAHCERRLLRTKKQMGQVHQDAAEGRINKAVMRDRLVALDEALHKERAQLAELLGRLRKEREARRVAA